MTPENWSNGDPGIYGAVKELYLQAPYLYRSPAAPDLPAALQQGASQVLYRKGKLQAVIITADLNQPVVELFICVCNDLTVDLSAGMIGLEQEAASLGASWLMVIAPPAWMLRTLIDTYQFIDTVVFYEWRYKELKAFPDLPLDVTLGSLQEADISQALRVDTDSFSPIWRANPSELNSWLAESQYALTLTAGNRIIAYLLAGQQGHKGHIYRIAVSPEWRGQGLGKWLMLYTMQKMLAARVRVISLNTQASNHVSRKLYEGLGFELTEQAVSIYAKELTWRYPS